MDTPATPSPAAQAPATPGAAGRPRPTIDVRPQVRLSAARIFGLCLKGIKHRLFRSLLTTTVIVLAVAFFMNLLSDSVVARAVDRGVRRDIGVLRRPAQAIDLWFGQPGAALLMARISADGAPLAAYAAITGWEPTRLQQLVADVRRERTFAGWIERLDSGTRAMLVRRARNDELMTTLSEGRRWSEFAQLAPQVRSPVMPLPLTEVQAAVAAGPHTIAEVAQFTTDWNNAIAALGSDLTQLTGVSGAAAWIDWLVAADANQDAAFAAALAKHGFATLWSAGDVTALRPALRAMAQRERVSQVLLSEEGRKRWLEVFRSKPALDEKLLRLDDPQIKQVVGDVSPADLAQIARSSRAERKLSAVESALVGKVDPAGGLVSNRQAFLVAISFVVCMVGIANAMLMAITERFREIATMKCLGATDGFILTQFLIEAGIQGAAGGLAGTVIGLALSLLKGTWLYGGQLWLNLPLLGLLVAGIACVGIGLLLATLASIYPSWRASRMAPMEAMRVE